MENGDSITYLHEKGGELGSKANGGVGKANGGVGNEMPGVGVVGTPGSMVGGVRVTGGVPVEGGVPTKGVSGVL